MPAVNEAVDIPGFGDIPGFVEVVDLPGGKTAVRFVLPGGKTKVRLQAS